jgi:hypothetical protein
MKEACEIYLFLSETRDREGAVRSLTDAELRSVSGLLGRIYDEGDISGELMGLCLVEGHSRFCKMRNLTAEGEES